MGLLKGLTKKEKAEFKAQSQRVEDVSDEVSSLGDQVDELSKELAANTDNVGKLISDVHSVIATLDAFAKSYEKNSKNSDAGAGIPTRSAVRQYAEKPKATTSARREKYRALKNEAVDKLLAKLQSLRAQHGNAQGGTVYAVVENGEAKLKEANSLDEAIKVMQDVKDGTIKLIA